MKRAMSIFLSVLLLVSSTGITYAQHFCGDYEMLAEVTLGEKHLSCGMKMEAPGCDEDGLAAMEHHCCENQYTQINTDDNFSKASFDVNLDVTFAVAFTSVFLLQIDNYPSNVTFYKDYSPPPLSKDIPVFYQVFLI